VRSTHSYTAFRRGHKWVVLAVLVRFPFAARPWALPVLVALYRSEEDNRRLGRRHKTPPDLLRQLPTRWRGERPVRRGAETAATFSDAITALRRWLWSEWVFAIPAHQAAFATIPPRLRGLLLRGLAPTASGVGKGQESS